MLARCARYPAATDRTLRLFPYFYFSQYGTRSRLPFGNGSRVAPFPIFLFFSIRHPIPLTLRQRIARCAFSHISIFLNTAPAPATLRQRIARRAICPSSRAHPLKGSSTRIQMLIDSNSNAHRLKFKGSSTQIQMLIDSNAQKRDAPGRRDAQKLWQKCTPFYSRRKHIVK